MLACFYGEHSRVVTHQFLNVGLFVWGVFKGGNSPVSQYKPVGMGSIQGKKLTSFSKLACFYGEHSRVVTHQFLNVGLFVWGVFKGGNSPVSQYKPVGMGSIQGW